MKETNTTNRREFIIRGAGTALTVGAASTLVGVHLAGAEQEEPVRLALIGCGGMGRGHLAGLVRRKSAVSIGWLCDVNPGQIEAAARVIGDFQSVPPQRSSRYEDVLADKSIDAVIIATPHHWHAPIGVTALAAGKDAYIEKPISHVYNEGKHLMAAAEKYGRVVQHGTQMRSSPVTQQAAKLLSEGIIGEVKVSRVDSRAAAVGSARSRQRGARRRRLRSLAGTGARNALSTSSGSSRRGATSAITATVKSATTVSMTSIWHAGGSVIR